MPIDSAAYLSAVSIMLASYGFFFSFYRDRIESGFEADETPPSENDEEAAIAEVSTARSAALLLGIVPLAVWLIFLGPVIEEVEAAFAVDFSFEHYSATDVAFVAAASAWFVIAFILLKQAVALWLKLRKLRTRQQKQAATAQRTG